MSEAKPTVLVTGAAGVMGLRLVARLRARGFPVRSLVVPGDPQRERLEQLGSEVREGDLRELASLQGLCEGVEIVYHLAAVIVSHDADVFRRVNRDGTQHLVQLADAACVRHFIYVSSASVTYPALTPYAQSKLDAERLVAARRGGYTIVRPTLVYDERGGLEVNMFLEYLRRFPVVPFIGPGTARKRPVWSEDIVDGLALLAGNRRALGKTYNFSGGESISMLEFAKLLLEHRAAPKPFVHLPVGVCELAAHVLALCMARPALTRSAIAGVVNDADLDPAEAMRDLGYQPIGVRAGFARCFPRAGQSSGARAQTEQATQEA